LQNIANPEKGLALIKSRNVKLKYNLEDKYDD